MGAAQTSTESTVYATMEEPEVEIIFKSDTKVNSARLLANPANFMTVDKLVSNMGFNSAEVVLALWDTLKEGC